MAEEAVGHSEHSAAPGPVAALYNDAAPAMERASSIDMRREREDLKAAAEQSQNVILDLDLNGTIRWVSASWQDVVGSTPESVKGKPISDLLLSNTDGFSLAVEAMKKDDSKSRIIRFRVAIGPDTVINSPNGSKISEGETAGEHFEAPEEEPSLSLKGQGIMVYDRASGDESHVRMLYISAWNIHADRSHRLCGCCGPPHPQDR